jgi:glycosyltransferase involved in cell wall biosynthesis
VLGNSIELNLPAGFVFMNSSISELVSVIIPSLNRPQLVSLAVRSALAQTMELIEVIVVIDGLDPATVEALKLIADPRLIIKELATNIGPAGARNIGIKAATGTWIAFLDDDDEWLPLKLERQLEVAHRSVHASPIVSSRFIAHTSNGDFIWPTRLPVANTSLPEYLFVRESLFLGEAFIVMPTILVKKTLLEKIPLNQNLPRHEDLDWLVRASQEVDVGLEFVSEPMAIVNMIYSKKRQSLSNVNDWKYSLNWIRSVRELISPQAYAGFLIAVVGPTASQEGDWPAFWPILRETLSCGKPRIFDIFLYMLMWMVPQDLRQKLRLLMKSKENTANKNKLT